MMIEDRFFDQEWVQELSNEDFRMLLYLFHFASKKTGIVELNMRVINFAANTGRQYTKADVLSRFGGMIRMIPGKENTAIFPDYIATNWAKGEKPIDIVKNPLFKSVVAELSSHGLTIADVNAMAKKQIVVKDDELEPEPIARRERKEHSEPSVSPADIDRMFEGFWTEWPKSCPRRNDKKKCREKFAAILKRSGDAVKMFNDIMNGLSKWKECELWTRDNGQFIRAPLVWLNGENWNDEPKKGGSNATGRKGASANANYRSEAGDDKF